MLVNSLPHLLPAAQSFLREGCCKSVSTVSQCRLFPTDGRFLQKAVSCGRPFPRPGAPPMPASCPHQVADQIAADMIASDQVRMQMWELPCDILPNGDPRREACTDHSGSMCFMSGAYSQGPLYGLRKNTTLLPWVSLLVCKYIRSCTSVPFTSFVLQRNTLMRAHRDLNNAPDSSNVVLPCSSFAGGGLWLKSTSGPGWHYARICEKSHTAANHLRPTPMA